MELMTIQIGKWRVARDRQIQFVDTTVKSGNDIFAPTWTMVLGHKDGTLTDAAYTDMYHARMFDSMRKHPDDWMRYARSDVPMAFACYCQPGVFCHRHLLVRLFESICRKHQIPFEYYGELE